MKNYVRIVSICGIIWMTAVLVFGIIIKKGDFRRSKASEDVTALNDIAKTAEENWNILSDYDFSDFGVDFVVLDADGKLIYDSSSEHTAASGEYSELTVERAIIERYPYKYIIKDDVVVGSVIISKDIDSIYRPIENRFLFALILSGMIIFIGTAIYGIYIHNNIVKPFSNLKGFAGKIAEGNLDAPLEMTKNNMFGAFTESFDIMREELAESRNREVELQRKEKELIASLSHDLKTPITGIKLTTELLSAKIVKRQQSGTWSSIDDDDITDKLDNIYKKADQIDVLVSDLFSSTLNDLGEFKVCCTDVLASDLSSIVRKYDDRELIREKKCPDVLINIDIKRMNQVIGNIISNSYKYANTEINVEYNLIDKYLEMQISDHGPGVSADELDLITNKFYRGKQQEKSGSSGSGLGLYIAKSLMYKMNGELICESGEEGFTVRLLLPIS